MLIVGSEIDSSSERIVNYLSETYGVSINAATFQYFRDQRGGEFLARVFLLGRSEVEQHATARPASKRRRNLSLDDLTAVADAKGVRELFVELVDQLRPSFDRVSTTLSSVAFIGRQGDRYNTIFSLVPGESSAERGVRFQVYSQRMADYCGVSEADVASLLPDDMEEWRFFPNSPKDYWGYAGFFQGLDEARAFVARVREVPASRAQPG